MKMRPMSKKGEFQKTAIGVAVVAIVITLGLLLTAKFNAAVPTGTFSAAENTTLNEVKTNTLGGFSLLSVGIMVLVGVGILAFIIKKLKA